MIKAQGIQKSYGHATVLSDVSFSLSNGQKVALVGHNGTGKTTLLRIVAGIEQMDAGSLEIQKGMCIGYLPQDTSLVDDITIAAYLRKVAGIDVLEAEMESLQGDLTDQSKLQRYSEVMEIYERLDGYSFPRKMETMLSGFGLEQISVEQHLTHLSSGQKSKIVLAGILLKGVDVLLLDEPTNNLDLPALIWLEDFLARSEAACMVVSHDRRFLDKVVRKIFELDWHARTLTITNGTYSDYLQMQAKRRERQKEEYLRQQEEIGRLTDLAAQKRREAARGSRWVGTDNDKFLRGFKRDRAAGSSRVAKALEKRIDHMDKVERPMERDPFEIPLDTGEQIGNLAIRASELVAGYAGPGGFHIGPLTLEIPFGNRVGIMGLNGTGKSTLLKTITGHMPPRSGTLEVGSGIKIGNLMQEHESLPREKSLLTFLEEEAGLKGQDAYATLTRFGFEAEQADALINALSPGGRARLLLALFSSQHVNVLVLDEPTNHLDIEALDALEETLRSYPGTVLLVSHDRYFIEHAGLNTVYVIENGELHRIPDYQAYLQSLEERARKLLRLL